MYFLVIDAYQNAVKQAFQTLQDRPLLEISRQRHVLEFAQQIRNYLQIPWQNNVFIIALQQLTHMTQELLALIRLVLLNALPLTLLITQLDMECACLNVHKIRFCLGTLLEQTGFVFPYVRRLCLVIKIQQDKDFAEAHVR